MKILSRHLVLGAAAMLLAAFAPAALAAPVVCGNLALGDRTVTVDPGKVGGFCYAQNDNLQNADITALGLVLIDKDVIDNAETDDPLQYTLTGPGNISGTWTIPLSLWTGGDYTRLYIGFHFGGGGDTRDDNPDSFVVELAPTDVSGSFILGGGQLNGLSNIYLLGTECGDKPCDPPLQVPEPGSLALFALALTVMGYSLRRRRVTPPRR